MPENRYSGDVFGKNISDGTTNDADLAGHYPYSQERWRFFETSLDESNRIFLEYSEDARYKHNAFGSGVSNGGSSDVHTISPNAGDTLYFRTNERFRYVVGYESVPTWAFSINKALSAGDVITVGPTDFTDGWACRFSGDLGAQKFEFIQLRGGTETEIKTFNLSKEITSQTRFEWRYAWYEIMGVLVSQSYSFDNWQLGNIASKGDREGPAIGNTPLSMKIEASGSTTGLEVYVGSCSWQTKGNIAPITRSKVINTNPQAHSGGGTWEPLAVVRKDPKRSFIQAELSQTQLVDFTGNGNAFVLAMVMSKQKVLDTNGNMLTDSNFATPDEISSTNSVLQFSTDIAQFPDSSGTPQTTVADPGGYQVGYSSIYADQGGGVEANPNPVRTVKRKLNSDDYLVILGKTSVSGNMTSEIVIEQNF